MDIDFDWVTAPEDLVGVVGEPHERVRSKTRNVLDEASHAFIARSPFAIIASCDAAGRMDVSPKGDPAGFVHAIDDRTLAIPDRPGNRRADTFHNVLSRPSVSVLFLIPGRGETLRVNGAAAISRAAWLRERLCMDGRVPHLVLVVRIEEVFLHCPKCAMRSRIWDTASWPRAEETAGLRSIPVRAPLY
jgi:PPOX class probable FMN-dependent enzyme